MKQTYRVVSGLIALGVLVQAAAVAFGWFQALSEVDGGLVIDQNYEGNTGHVVHGLVGMFAMPVLGLVLLIVSFLVGRAVPRARTWAGIVLAAIVVQVAFAFIAFGVPAVGALHGLNALIIFAAAARAFLLVRPGTPAPTGPAQQAGTHGSSVPV